MTNLCPCIILPVRYTQLYGFPPNVGAVGTAALLNVGTSLANLLKELKGQGYSVGGTGLGLGPQDGKHLALPLSCFSDFVFYSHIDTFEVI